MTPKQMQPFALCKEETIVPHFGLRHSIIHANLPTPHALDVMANLQGKYDAGYPEMQPGFLWWIGDIYAASYGPKRGQRLEPFRTLQSRAVLWSGGSDYFVTPVAARFGLWASPIPEVLRHASRRLILTESARLWRTTCLPVKPVQRSAA